jgi:hypothetical protein
VLLSPFPILLVQGYVHLSNRNSYLVGTVDVYKHRRSAISGTSYVIMTLARVYSSCFGSSGTRNNTRIVTRVVKAAVSNPNALYRLGQVSVLGNLFLLMLGYQIVRIYPPL